MITTSVNRDMRHYRFTVFAHALVARRAVRDGPVTVNSDLSMVTTLDVAGWNGESGSCAPSYTPPSLFLPSLIIIILSSLVQSVRLSVDCRNYVFYAG